MESGISVGGQRPGGPQGGRYRLVMSAVLLAGITFTLTDLITSFVALNEGFSEGNSLLNGLAAFLHLGTIESLIVMKTIFIFGITVQALVGFRARDRTTKRTMLASVTFFMVLLAFVSFNNLCWIAS
ncbi:MAG TPA: hypothetical protein VLX56_05725 [Nitrososphaerales archaeon]|nr:hypothetical protein [Nitrososphaerales archaeon]